MVNKMPDKKFTDSECSEKMKKIIEQYGHDEEACHALADDLLCDILNNLGFKETVKLFDEISKYYA